MCIDALSAERSRQHTKYVQAATGKKTYGIKPKQMKELKGIQTMCEQFGQKSPLQYLEGFAHRMELPNPEEEYLNPEPSTSTPVTSAPAAFTPATATSVISDESDGIFD